MTIHATQPQTSIPFVDMNGSAWPLGFVETYNRFTDLINQSANRDIASGSMAEREREFLLDQRHKNYLQFCDVCQQPAGQSNKLTK